MIKNTSIESSIARGFFIHSSATVDDLWLNLQSFNELLLSNIEAVIDKLLKKLKFIDKNQTVNTIFYFDNKDFQLDQKLDICLQLKNELVKRNLESELGKKIYHCFIKDNRSVVGLRKQIKLKGQFLYEAIVIFPTSFHSSSIGSVVDCLIKQYEINIKGIIFLVHRENDEIKNYIKVPYHEIFKISRSDLDEL